jgi:hypothetical protein
MKLDFCATAAGVRSAPAAISAVSTWGLRQQKAEREQVELPAVHRRPLIVVLQIP